MNTISLNLLDRDVRVGCLYNYKDAKILPEMIKISRKDVEVMSYADPLPTVDHTTTTDVSEKGRLSCIGINQHLSRQLDAKEFDINRLWFYNFLTDESFRSCNNNEVHITVYLKFAREAKYLTDDFITSNIRRCRNNHDGGTHLVQYVEYGAEFVLWMHRPVDILKETKQFVEQTVDIALENYLEKLFDGVSPSLPSPHKALFDTMSCSFQSSIPNGCMSNRKFEECIQRIQELTVVEENDQRNVWHPVEMRLRRIPTDVEVEVAIDFEKDTVFELKQTYRWIGKQCRHLIKSPFFHRIPFLKSPLIEFEKLLEPMASVVNEIVTKLKANCFSRSRCYKVSTPYMKLFIYALNWLSFYQENVELMHFVLKGNSLPVLDLRSIKEPVKDSRDVKRTKVFALQFACITTALVERFKKWTRNPAKNLKVFKWEDFDDTEWEDISTKFSMFLNEAVNSVDNDVDYAVGILSPNSPYEAGSVFTIGYEEILRAVQCTPPGASSPNSSYLSSSEDSPDTEKDCCDDEMI